jgi:hypothetical protein
MRYKAYHNELVDTMRLKLQIQIGVGKTTGAPMLKRYDVPRLGRELRADLSTPGSVFEGLVRPGCLLNGRYVLPRLVVPRAVPVSNEHANACIL